MNIKKLIRNICLITVGAMIFTTIIIQIPNPFFDDMGNKGDWIGFFGAITGGVLTLYGVWWTIDDRDRDRKLENANTNIPIIDISIDSTSFAKHDDPCGAHDYTIYFKIKNIGKVAAKDIVVDINHDAKKLAGAGSGNIKINFLYNQQSVQQTFVVGYWNKEFHSFSIKSTYNSNNNKDSKKYEVTFKYKLGYCNGKLDCSCSEINYSNN